MNKNAKKNLKGRPKKPENTKYVYRLSLPDEIYVWLEEKNLEAKFTDQKNRTIPDIIREILKKEFEKEIGIKKNIESDTKKVVDIIHRTVENVLNIKRGKND